MRSSAAAVNAQDVVIATASNYGFKSKTTRTTVERKKIDPIENVCTETEYHYCSEHRIKRIQRPIAHAVTRCFAWRK